MVNQSVKERDVLCSDPQRAHSTPAGAESVALSLQKSTSVDASRAAVPVDAQSQRSFAGVPTQGDADDSSSEEERTDNAA